ncbi:transposase [Streptomyces olivoreticuli]
MRKAIRPAEAAATAATVSMRSAVPVADEITAWQSRPLDAVWPVVYIDALWIKVRDGKVANRPIYLAVGVDLDSCKHVLGLWIGKDGEGARQWLTILGELKARGEHRRKCSALTNETSSAARPFAEVLQELPRE